MGLCERNWWNCRSNSSVTDDLDIEKDINKEEEKKIKTKNKING